eukprot:Platyproteum_vivax@DN6516_c0_g1_i4.p2
MYSALIPQSTWDLPAFKKAPPPLISTMLDQSPEVLSQPPPPNLIGGDLESARLPDEASSCEYDLNDFESYSSSDEECTPFSNKYKSASANHSNVSIPISQTKSSEKLSVSEGRKLAPNKPRGTASSATTHIHSSEPSVLGEGHDLQRVVENYQNILGATKPKRFSRFSSTRSQIKKQPGAPSSEGSTRRRTNRLGKESVHTN